MAPVEKSSTICAQNRLLLTPPHLALCGSSFISLLCALPITRGAGIFQPDLDNTLEFLAREHAWLHLYPEGFVHPPDNPAEIQRCRPGIGRLVAELPVAPVVVPIAHVGMELVKPWGTWLPRVAQKVTVVVGEPIDVEALVPPELRQRLVNESEQRRRDVALSVAAAVEDALLRCKREAVRLHREQR